MGGLRSSVPQVPYVQIVNSPEETWEFVSWDYDLGIESTHKRIWLYVSQYEYVFVLMCMDQNQKWKVEI